MRSQMLKVVMLAAMLMVTTAEVKAQANVLNISESQLQVPQNADEKYDRIVMKRSIPADRWTAFVLPADLDGFYFGVEAERFIISSVSKGDVGDLVIKTLPMTESEDFVSGVPYLVKPKVGAEELVFLTAGIQTVVNKEAGELYCMDATGWKSEVSAIATTAINGKIDGKAYDLSGREVRVSEMLEKGGFFIYNGKKQSVHK